MKIFGYVRDKDGNFENRKNRVIEFSKQMNLPIDEMICEEAYDNYSDMIKIRELLETENDFVLLVSDASDLFEDDYACIKLLQLLEENNVFLIDTYYPNLDYHMLIEKNSKDCPSNFLQNRFMVILEVYMRKKYSSSDDNAVYGDMRTRFSDWKNNLKNE